LGYKNIIPSYFKLNAQLAKLIQYLPQFKYTGIFNQDLTLCHGSHTNERTDFNHIGKHAMFRSDKFRHTIDL
jgi:hypothetical protein